MDKVNAILKDSGYQFVYPDYSYGQDYALVFLNGEEKNILEKEAGWKFPGKQPNLGENAKSGV